MVRFRHDHGNGRFLPAVWGVDAETESYPLLRASTVLVDCRSNQQSLASDKGKKCKRTSLREGWIYTPIAQDSFFKKLEWELTKLKEHEQNVFFFRRSSVSMRRRTTFPSASS